MVLVRKRNVSLRRFFYAPKHMFDRKKIIKIIFLFGISVYISTDLYNSSLQFFEIKPLVLRTSNLRCSTVYTCNLPTTTGFAIQGNATMF